MVYTLPSKYIYPNSTTLDSLTTTFKGLVHNSWSLSVTLTLNN